jgi:hypothetical protein
MAYTNIDDPSAHFQIALYAGTGSELVITNNGNSNLQPDFLWIKSRTEADANHHAHNTNVATTRTLFVNKTDYEETQSQSVKSVQSNGFTLGTWAGNNKVSNNFVAWQWKANGGTTASNTSGSITSTVQVNTDAGFSIVNYTGNGTVGNSSTTIGHGLSQRPDAIIIKDRDSLSNWSLWHTYFGANKIQFLNQRLAIATDNDVWANTLPTSSVFCVGNSAVNTNNNNYVAYCFHNVQGYSKFGSYIGNGFANGPFIYTGFKPAYFIVKDTGSSGSSWRILDGARNPFNFTDLLLALQEVNGGAELDGSSHSSNIGVDFVSNGIKIRTAYPQYNFSGRTYIYMAFAENPFVTSTGIPTTAR